MDELSVQFGISVFIVNIFHYLKKYIPWIDRETDKAIRVVSITTAMLSAAGFTFAVHKSILSIEVDIPVFIRFVINTAVQHGMSQIYHSVVYKKFKPQSDFLSGQLKMAGHIPPGPIGR